MTDEGTYMEQQSFEDEVADLVDRIYGLFHGDRNDVVMAALEAVPYETAKTSIYLGLTVPAQTQHWLDAMDRELLH